MKKAFFILSFMLSIMLFQAALAANGKIRLAWDPNQETDLAGYKLYYGMSPWSFEEPIKVGIRNGTILKNLTKGQSYYIALTAYDWTAHESFFSNQVHGIAHDAIYGNWVFDISREDKGGAILFFDDNNNTVYGYGVSERFRLFGIEGTYEMDEDKKIDGTFSIYDFDNDGTIYETLWLTGKVNSKYTKVTFKTDSEDVSSVNILLKGLWKAGEEVHKSLGILEEWTIKITGRMNGKSTKGTIDSFKIEPFQINGESYPHLFRISGSGFINEGPVDVEGVFFTTERDKVYGKYEYKLIGEIVETGFFSGKIKATSKRFSFKFVSDNGNKYTFRGKMK